VVVVVVVRPPAEEGGGGGGFRENLLLPLGLPRGAREREEEERRRGEGGRVAWWPAAACSEGGGGSADLVFYSGGGAALLVGGVSFGFGFTRLPPVRERDSLFFRGIFSSRVYPQRPALSLLEPAARLSRRLDCWSVRPCPCWRAGVGRWMPGYLWKLFTARILKI
jgi:hypothetical protein